ALQLVLADRRARAGVVPGSSRRTPVSPRFAGGCPDVGITPRRLEPGTQQPLRTVTLTPSLSPAAAPR
ncbi:MAG TPA: hypothetical protein VER33_09445, partial [Polyangiaceae bacterium]|nr:hypothetical protein [Polyangiaceae bacterium]